MPSKTRYLRWAGWGSISVLVAVVLVLTSSISPVWATPAQDPLQQTTVPPATNEVGMVGSGTLTNTTVSASLVVPSGAVVSSDQVLMKAITASGALPGSVSPFIFKDKAVQIRVFPSPYTTEKTNPVFSIASTLSFTQTSTSDLAGGLKIGRFEGATFSLATTTVSFSGTTATVSASITQSGFYALVDTSKSAGANETTRLGPGTLSNTAVTATLTVPSGAIDNDVQIIMRAFTSESDIAQFTGVTSPHTFQKGARLSVFKDSSVRSSTTFSPAATLTFTLPFTPPADYDIAKFSGGLWQLQSATIDTSAKTVSKTISSVATSSAGVGDHYALVQKGGAAGVVVTAPAATATPTPTVTPTPTPTATPTPTPVPVATAVPTVAPPVVAAVVQTEVRVTPKVGAKAEAVVDGQKVEVKAVEIKAATDPVTKKTEIELPAVVAVGKKLELFTDPESGVKVEKNVITIPIKDPKAVTALVLEAKVKEVVGTGTSAKAEVTEIKLKASEQKVDLTAAKPEVGKVSTSFDLGLKEIPKGASVKIEVKSAPTAADDKAITQAASGAGTKVTKVAYVMEVTKTNIPAAIQGEAKVTMKVSKKWADDQGGAAKVRIIRVADDGTPQILATKVLGVDADGNLIFEGTSPQGLSAFGLVALETPPEVTPPAGGSVGTITAALGGSVASLDGRFKLALKAGAVTQTVVISLEPVKSEAAPALPTGIVFPADMGPFELKVLDVTGKELKDFSFSVPGTLTVKISAENLKQAGNQVHKFMFRRYQTLNKVWLPLTTSYDILTNQATAEVGSLSLVGLTIDRPVFIPAATPTPTAVPPVTGDYSPGTSTLAAALLAALALMVSGGYFLARGRREEENP